jgi:hypothetical protein
MPKEWTSGHPGNSRTNARKKPYDMRGKKQSAREIHSGTWCHSRMNALPKRVEAQLHQLIEAPPFLTLLNPPTRVARDLRIEFFSRLREHKSQGQFSLT